MALGRCDSMRSSWEGPPVGVVSAPAGPARATAGASGTTAGRGLEAPARRGWAASRQGVGKASLKWNDWTIGMASCTKASKRLASFVVRTMATRLPDGTSSRMSRS